MPGQAAEATLAYLRERELVSYAYDEARLPVELDDGAARRGAWPTSRTRAHPQYCGGLSLEEQAEVIARAVGPRGPNADYLLNTVESLEALGLHDPELSVWPGWCAHVLPTGRRSCRRVAGLG